MHGRWYAVAGTADCYEMLTDRAGIVTLERREGGDWWLRTPRDPDGHQAAHVGRSTVGTAKSRAGLLLALRDGGMGTGERGGGGLDG